MSVTKAAWAVRYFYYYESLTETNTDLPEMFSDWMARHHSGHDASVPTDSRGDGQHCANRHVVARIRHLVSITQLANPVTARKLTESSALFALFSGQHVVHALNSLRCSTGSLTQTSVPSLPQTNGGTNHSEN